MCTPVSKHCTSLNPKTFDDYLYCLDEEMDDSDGDPDYVSLRKNEQKQYETDTDTEQPPPVKRKKRWTDEENQTFKCLFRK